LRSSLFICLGTLVLAGCNTTTVGPRPPVERPKAWPEGLAVAAMPDDRFLEGFGSPELIALTREAVADNPDLISAEARIRAADARVRMAGSALLPTLSAGAAITRIQGSSSGVSASETDRGLTLSASYEPDFWGAARSARRAARADVRGSRADVALLRLTLQASVADTCIELLGVRAERATIRRRIDALTEATQLLEARQAAGLVSGVELTVYRTNLANVRTLLAPLGVREVELAAGLALLVGRDSPVELSQSMVLQRLRVPGSVGAEPAELLARRPDVIAAESALAAADANLAAARAALFPHLTLDMVAARQNPGFQAVLTTLAGTGQTLSLGAALTQALFDGGRRRAVRAEAKAHQEELVAAYRRSILNALVDAQRAFAVRQVAAQLRIDAGAVVEQAADQEQALKERGGAGLGDRLAVLDVEQMRLQAEEAFDQAHAQELRAAVGLFKALGGGWRGEADQ